MLSITSALIATAIMAAIILLCRIVPYLFFRKTAENPRLASFIRFVEKTVPPVAMTSLAFNAIAVGLRSNLSSGLAGLLASLITVVLHLWRRNPLLSIGGGTGVYMIIIRVLNAG